MTYNIIRLSTVVGVIVYKVLATTCSSRTELHVGLHLFTIIPIVVSLILCAF